VGLHIEEVIDLYQKSPEWERLSSRSRKIYSDALAKVMSFMDKEITSITRVDVFEILDVYKNKAATTRTVISVLRNLFDFACSRGYANQNPALGLRNMRQSKPIPRWPMNEVEAFLEKSPPHLQLVVLMALYTGQRRCDLIKIRWEDYDGGTIKVTQRKTGKHLVIPLHPRLKAAIDSTKRREPVILTNAYGSPWSESSVSAAVRKQARVLGLKNTSIHGLRKSTASHLAEAGATVHQIAAVTGQSLKEVERYTRQADQRTMAQQAMEMWK